MANANKLFDERNDAIKFVDDYVSMILEAKRKTADEEPEPEPEPSKARTKRKKSPLQLHEEYINEIKNDEQNINEKICKEYFLPNSNICSKELYNSNQNKNDEILKYINDASIEFEKDSNIKKFLLMNIQIK